MFFSCSISVCKHENNFDSVKIHPKQIFVLVLAAWFLSAGAKAWGMNLYSYDLDSLVYMSPQIVEGRFVSDEYRTDNVAVLELEISAVHKGNLKVGQSIKVTELYFYQVSTKGFGGGEKLKKGDSLFLFFDRAKNNVYFNTPTNAEIYWPAPSGVQLIVGKKVVGFSQYNNPGPWVAVLEGIETNNAIPSVQKFREQIRESVERVEKWKLLLERQATTNDIPTLLQILRGRNHANYYDGNRFDFSMRQDLIAEKAAQSLASLHDMPALTEALGAQNSYLGILGGGFGTTTGRDFLISKISDNNEPAKTRIKWANALKVAGLNSDEHDFSKVARLIATDSTSEDLKLALIGCLQNPIFPRDDTPQKPADDIQEASSILKQLSKGTNSEEIKYEIDLALAAFHGDQANTDSPPIISILSLCDPKQYNVPSGKMAYFCQFRVLQSGHWTAMVAFVEIKSGKKWLVPTSDNLGVAGSGVYQISLPTDLPHGHYHVFYEFSDDGKVAGTSHYFETDL